MRNKRGEQIVEAAMVLPILILTILSLILLMIYFFTCLQNQTDLHTEMIRHEQKSGKTFELYKKNVETSDGMEGLVHMLMKKQIKSSIYVFNEADFIRAGEMLGFE